MARWFELEHLIGNPQMQNIPEALLAPVPEAIDKPAPTIDLATVASIQESKEERPERKEAPKPVPSNADSQLSALFSQLNAKQLDSLKEQKAGLEDLAAQANKMKNRDPKLNLAPTLNYYDNLFGTNMLRGYKQPQSQDAIDKQALDMGAMIQKRRGELAGNEIDILKSKVSAALQAQKMKKDKTQDPKFVADQRVKLFKEFQRDKKVTELSGAYDAAGEARQILSSGTPIGDSSVVMKLARAMGAKGVLSDRDIAMYSGSKDVANRLEGVYDRWKTGKLTEKDRQNMFQLLEIMEKSAQDKLKKRVGHYENELAPRVFGLNPESVEGTFLPQDYFKKTQPSIPEFDINHFKDPSQRAAAEFIKNNPSDPRAIKAAKKLGIL